MTGRIWPRIQPDGTYLVLKQPRPGKWLKCGKLHKTSEGWYSEAAGATFAKKKDAAAASVQATLGEGPRTAPGAGGPGPAPGPVESVSEPPFRVGTYIRGRRGTRVYLWEGTCCTMDRYHGYWRAGIRIRGGGLLVSDVRNWDEVDQGAPAGEASEKEV